jgi:ribosomal protein S18 acetylase RimI-like enzyme
MIRRFRPGDRAEVYEVCLRTANAGADATGLYSSDDLMPELFAGPYLEFEPELAFVVHSGGRVGGYVLGTSDTRAFVSWYREHWMPRLDRFDGGQMGETEGAMLKLGRQPEHMLIPEVDEYPAHLHIDLLPDLQGRGVGRELISTLLGALRARGVQRVHLAMDPANHGARAFYDRLGFHELPSSTPTEPVLGIAT